MIVANDVTAEGAGFDHATNIVTLYARDGRDLPLPRMSKLRWRSVFSTKPWPATPPQLRRRLPRLNMPIRLLRPPNDKLSRAELLRRHRHPLLLPRSCCRARGRGARASHWTIPIPQEETLPKTSPKPIAPLAPSIVAPTTPKVRVSPIAPKVSLFDAANKIADDSLLKIRED